MRRLMLVLGLLATLYPTWDWIDFLRIKKSAILKIPMRTVFSIYIIFIISAMLVYAWRFVKIVRHGLPEDHPELRESFQDVTHELHPEDKAEGDKS